MAERVLGNLIVNLIAYSEKFEAGLETASEKLEHWGDKMEQVGEMISEKISEPLKEGKEKVTELGVEWDEKWEKIAAMTSASTDDIEQWKKQVLELAGSDLGRGPLELADAMYLVATNGYHGSEAMNILKNSAMGAAAGMGTTSNVVSSIVTALNTMHSAGLSVDEAFDVLVKTAQQANAKVEDIAPVFGKLLLPAKELGMSFADVGASLAQMTRMNGDAALSATQLAALLGSVLRPTAALEKGFDAAGMKVEEFKKILRDQGILAAMTELQKRAKDAGVSLADIFPRKEAGLGALAFTAKGVEEVFDGMKQHAGALQEAVEKTDGAGRKMAANTAAVSASLIAIWETIRPIVEHALDKFRERLEAVVKWWQGLSEETKKSLAGWAEFLIWLGPIMGAVGTALAALAGFVGVLATCATAITSILSYAGGLEAVLAAIPEMFATLVGGLGGIVASIGAVLTSPITLIGAAVVGILIMFRQPLMEFVDWIVSKFKILGGLLPDLLTTPLRFFEDTVISVFQSVIMFAAGCAGKIVDWFGNAFMWIANMLRQLGLNLFDFFAGNGGAPRAAPTPKGPSTYTNQEDTLRNAVGVTNNISTKKIAPAADSGDGTEADTEEKAANLPSSSKSQTIIVKLDQATIAKASLKGYPQAASIQTGFRGSF